MDYASVRNRLIRAAAKTKTPMVGAFELTPSCNLACKMCYVRESFPKKELSTAEWKTLILEAKNAGLLFCLFTGGEIFLRSDFQDIYEFTYDLGMRISLFTNGTLISDEVVNYLKKRKPDLVAITLYGINPHQYQEITGSAQAFSQVSSAIKRLKEAKITVVVRTIAVQTIYRHLDDVINYLKELHLPVSYSLYVGPKRSCLGSSNIERLNPEQLVIYQSQFKQAFGESLTIELSDCLESFRCLAGKSSYFIRWDGMMMPCAMLEYPSFMAKDDFARAWKKLNLAINNVPLCEGYEDCSVRSFCLQCPARRYLEGGFAQCSPYLKAIATLLKEGKQ